MTKRKLPEHGHLGTYAVPAFGPKVEDMIREKYTIPKGAKIVKTFMYSDPPYKVYDCEVIIPKKNKVKIIGGGIDTDRHSETNFYRR